MVGRPRPVRLRTRVRIQRQNGRALAVIPFVGRHRELRILAHELERTARGGRLVLVVGEAGVGKSRFLREFAGRERGRARLLVGRGAPASTAIPFSVFAEALESELRRLPPATLGELGPERLAGLAHVLPSAATQSPHPAAPSRLGVLEALRALLEALARDRPLVVLLDDIHQADPSSWEALNYLGRNPPAAAVLLVAAVRPGELVGTPQLAAQVGTLVKDGLAEEVRLPALAPDEVAALARRALPASAAPDTAQWLFARARGNALYTLALLEELAVDPGRRVVPIGVQERVRMILVQLPAGARAAAEAAAVVGGFFSPADLLALLPTLTPEDFDALAGAGLVAAGEAGYEFVHPVVQEAIYAGLGPARRLQLHGLAGRSLPGRPLSIRAYHAGLGAVPGDRSAYELLRLAARQSEREEAHGDAIAHLDRALAILPPDAAAERREVLDELAWQASAAGDHAAGIRALTALAELVDGEPEEAARTDVRLASFLATGAGDLDAAERCVVRAVRRLSGPRLAAARNELAWIRGEAGDLAAQVAESREAAALARAAGDDEVLLHALGCLGHGLALLGQAEESIAVLEESLELARANGDRGQVGWHAGSLGTALLLAGRGEAACRLLDGLLEARANPSDVAYFSRALAGWQLGRWQSALADARAVQALNTSAPSVHSAWVLSLAGAVLAAQGRPESARTFLAQSERVYAGRPFYCFSAWHDWAAGHAAWFLEGPAAARPRFEAALARLEGMGAAAAAAMLRPDLAQCRAFLGEDSVPPDAGTPLRRARALELAGDLAGAARAYAALGAAKPEAAALARLRAGGPAGRRAARGAGSLSGREREVAGLAAAGLSDREIAARLTIGERTVETHLAHVYAKLGISGRGQLPAAFSGSAGR